MAKAIVWIRTSTVEQEVETQKSLLTSKAKKDGFNDEDIVIIGKPGASAIKMNALYQQEVNELIEIIQTDPEITTVYVWEVSRLARNELAFYQMKDTLINHQIQLVCDVPSLRLLDDDGEVNTGAELSLNLLVTLAKQEMTIKKKRMSRGKKRLAEQGKYNGGAIPYGYRIDKENDNEIVRDEGGEADVVREIYNLYESGMSQPAIAKELFERGIPGRSARPTNKFTISLVHQILTNELLTGKPHLSKGASYERVYPMIITPEQYERCRRIAETNNRVAPKSRRVYYAHRLIKCTECGRAFASTGGKGYYHCWDAYYPYKDINGYEGVPRCKNRVCISVNVMDSLLWNLAQEYETTFIVNSAQQKLAECANAKAVIEQKLMSLPSLRQSVEDRMDSLLDALAEGMKKDRFQSRKRKLDQERKELDRTEAEYKEQITRYDSLMSEIRESITMEDNALESEEAIDAFIDNMDAIQAKVSSITDDVERSRIIHKHIYKVTVEAATINYKFKIHPEGKEAFAKRITVYSYMEKPQVFYFVPYNGKGGVMLRYNPLGNQTVSVFGRDITTPEYLHMDMTYLPRIYDASKYRRREAERKSREKRENQYWERLNREGYLSMKEMMEITGLSYSTLYNAIKAEKMKGRNELRTWFVKKDDFEAYLQKYNPRPRPVAKKDTRSPAQKLLDAITTGKY